ncbi:hypothetical protein BDY19DRAFT_195783 [Irpex rosettiformis]|uniref:Uncharacterized protein n=1 Tax=Irpex rosettiformis TaxID=378272 RepID=A0ACB8U278_9APHY|nr:hypothetical protein BDY19DRAFT_195783 [Irpex rosettiformis]
MPLSQNRTSPALSRNTRHPSSTKLPPSFQPDFTPSPHNSSGSGDTLTDDPYERRWNPSPPQSSTPHEDGLGTLSNMSSVPIPWLENSERATTFSSRTSKPLPAQENHKTSQSHEDVLDNLLSYERPSTHTNTTHSSSERSPSPEYSPAVTNLTLDASVSPSIVHRDLESDGSLTSKRRHSQFYLTDTLVILEVDSCLFKLHRYFLNRESIYFRDLFIQDPTAGTCEDNAITLTNITIHEFECLLHFLFFGVFDPNRYVLVNWLDLLAAATILKCSNIRQRAILELDSPTFSASIDAADRIFIARKYDVDAWLFPAYVDLCLRDGALREQEIDLLGSRLTAQVYEIERSFSSRRWMVFRHVSDL